MLALKKKLLRGLETRIIYCEHNFQKMMVSVWKVSVGRLYSREMETLSHILYFLEVRLLRLIRTTNYFMFRAKT